MSGLVKEDFMIRILVALAALTTSFASPSFAQPGAHPAKGVLAQHSGVMLADHTMRASKLIGMAVYNDQGEKVGTIDDVMVTAGAVEPTVVVSVGSYLGGGEKLAAEPLSHVKLAPGDKMMMPGATKTTLAAKPSFKYDYSLEGGGG
jgi:hypothetical protein